MVERADGSDSRLIGQDVMPPQQADFIYGPGWSPDGNWLAWSAVSIGAFDVSSRGSFAVQTNGVERLELLDEFSGASMQWGPDGEWLLVSGSLKICSDSCHYTTHWLVDMTTQHLVTSLDLRPAIRGAGSTPVEWEQEHVAFYDIEELGNHRQYYRITLGFGGTTTKQPISPEAYAAVLSEDLSTGLFDYAPLDSPGGRYTAPAFSDTLLDTQTGKNIALPTHSRAASGVPPMEAHWHPSESWVLLGSNWRETESRQVGYVTVMSLPGGVQRELSSCGFDQGCVNWLPQYVNIDEMPPGAQESVLPAPVSYDYDVEFEAGPGALEKYVLVCDETINILNMVQDIVTSEVVFVLEDAPPCPAAGDTRLFPFALGPNGNTYAANTGYGLASYTAIYDAATGEPLIILPTVGWEMSFSGDDLLLMRSQNARMRWDVQELLRSKVP